MSEVVAIVGSRDWLHPRQIRQVVDDLADDTVVVTGGARGVDSWAARAARNRGLKVIVHPAEWERYGKTAGFIRNALIVDECDRLIAFQRNGSRGTQNSIDLANRAGKPVVVFT